MLKNEEGHLNYSGYLSVGASRAAITPRNNVFLAGHRRARFSKSVADDLFARCIILQNESLRIALISCDLLWLSLEHTEMIRDAVAAKNGIERENVFVACTHTHSGPFTSKWTTISSSIVDDEWINGVVTTCAELVPQALRTMCFARIVNGRTNLSLAVSRRLRVLGTIYRFPTFLKPTKQYLSVLDFRRLDGSSVATIFHYAMHPVLLGPRSRVISCEWCGVACRHVEYKLNNICIFLNGAMGDLTPKTILWRNRMGVRRIGAEVGHRVLQCISSGTTVEQPSLAVETRILLLAAHLHPYLEVRHGDRAEASREVFVRLSAIRIGERILLGTPGECLTTTADAIVDSKYKDEALVVSCVDDYLGYLPPPEVISEGGYEARARLLSEHGIVEIIQAGASLIEAIGRGPRGRERL